MFCAFDNPALILRTLWPGQLRGCRRTGWDALAAHFPLLPGARQIFDITVESLQTSCGWGVPRMTLRQPAAQTLAKYHAQQAPGEAASPRSPTRTRSIDGLPVRVQQVMPGFDPLP